jgi:hypothetical protein
MLNKSPEASQVVAQAQKFCSTFFRGRHPRRRSHSPAKSFAFAASILIFSAFLMTSANAQRLVRDDDVDTGDARGRIAEEDLLRFSNLSNIFFLRH